MVTGPGDELAAAAAGRGRLRVSYSDREQVIGTLKAAFVQGMLAKDESRPASKPGVRVADLRGAGRPHR